MSQPLWLSASFSDAIVRSANSIENYRFCSAQTWWMNEILRLRSIGFLPVQDGIFGTPEELEEPNPTVRWTVGRPVCTRAVLRFAHSGKIK